MEEPSKPLWDHDPERAFDPPTGVPCRTARPRAAQTTALPGLLAMLVLITDNIHPSTRGFKLSVLQL